MVYELELQEPTRHDDQLLVWLLLLQCCTRTFMNKNTIVLRLLIVQGFCCINHLLYKGNWQREASRWRKEPLSNKMGK